MAECPKKKCKKLFVSGENVSDDSVENEYSNFLNTVVKKNIPSFQEFNADNR